MATALEDIRVEHEESLRGMEGKIKESYEKKIADLDAKFRRQKELTEQKRNEASQAKALQAQANTQLARAEKDVSLNQDYFPVTFSFNFKKFAVSKKVFSWPIQETS